jgi:hypothetical protein
MIDATHEHTPLASEPLPPYSSGRQRPRRRLPLEGQAVRWAGGWEVRLPLRAEHVVVDKETVIAERVTVRRGLVTDVVRVQDTVAREELRVESSGDLAVASGSDDDRLGLRPHTPPDSDARRAPY